MSDGWAAYNNINGGIYEHQVIIHQENFVDPENEDVHTQTIESLWSRVKRKFKRQYGTSQALFPSYVHEFMWRNSHKNHFSAILIWIAQQYQM